VLRGNDLKSRLAQQQRAFGSFASLGSPVAAEIAGLAGYDFVLVDGEHGPSSHADHRAMVQAIAATSATPAIRVAGNDPIELKRAADLGFQCILVPEVQTAADARAALEGVYYPPRGRRSCAAPLLRASNYGMQTQAYLDSMTSGGIVMAMLVETAEGAANAADIAAIEGVDVVFVGPYDIAATLGVLGEVEHPVVQAAVASIEAAVLRAGKILGGLPYGSISVQELCRRGYQFIIANSDVAILRDQLIGELRHCKAVQESSVGSQRHT
jgi:2-keto-3-deoxy-L-rhamnonate aldolase RhmA